MTFKLKFFDQVIADIQEAKIWYKNQKVGLEIKLGICIEEALIKILNNPKNYVIRYKNIRIAHPKLFPYNIHFYIDENESLIVITAIVHNKRHLNIAKKRI